MDDIIRDPHHLPAAGIRLPERGFGIDRRKALLAAAICWTGFAIMVWLVLTGRTGGLDEMGLLAARRHGDLDFAGSHLMLEIVRDTTALGGVFLRNLFAIGAVLILSVLLLV